MNTRLTHSVLGGAAGAATLTLAHEVLRRLDPRAPRLDKLGMIGLASLLRASGSKPPRGDRLQGYALIGDLLANTLYYASVGAGRRVSITRGGLIGLAAGMGAVFLTPVVGLPKRHRGRGRIGQLLTIGLYALGGLAAAAMARALGPEQTHLVRTATSERFVEA